MLIFGGRQLGIKKHGRYSYPCFKGPENRLPNQISHAHAYVHRRLRLILRFGLFEFLRFLKQFRITANACYIFPMCHTATLRSGNLAFQQVPFTTNRRYLMAKVQRLFGTTKYFLIKSQKSLVLSSLNRNFALFNDNRGI